MGNLGRCILRQYILLLSIVFLYLVLIHSGCRGNPVQPVHQPEEISALPSGNSDSHLCLGMYSISIDSETLTVTAVPARTSDVHLNLSRVFINTFNLAIAVIPGESDPANGLFTLDFTLTHPIPMHPEFTAFDIRGIVMSPGSLDIDTVIFSGLDETQLENADGFSRWWNPTEFTDPGIFGYEDGLFTNTTSGVLTATVNPFKYFADILGPTDDLSAVPGQALDSEFGRLLFSSGTSNTRRYSLRFPMDPTPVIEFGYVIDGSWAESTPNPPGEVPDDFPFDANQPEAYNIVFHTTENTLYVDSESGTWGGTLGFQANINDWQGQNAMDIASEIASVEFFCPALFSGSVTAAFLSETDNKARYSADITPHLSPTQSGEILAAVRVTTAGGTNYNQGLAYTAPAEPIEAWQTLILDIPDPPCIADTNNDFSDAITIEPGVPVYDLLCATTDYRDFYKFTVGPCDIAIGSVTLICYAEPTEIALYDSTETLITEAPVSGGSANIDIGSFGLSPGLYYLRVITHTSGQAFPYTLETNFTIDYPAPPTDSPEITPLDFDLQPRVLYAHENYLIATHNENYSDVSIWVYDITDPADPVAISKLKLQNRGASAFSYPYMYVYREENWDSFYVSVVDFTDFNNPVLHPDVLWFEQEPCAMGLESNYLYISVMDDPNSPINVYDISSDPFNPVYITDFLSGIPWPSFPTKFEFIYDSVGPDYWMAVMGLAAPAEGSPTKVFDVTDKGAITLHVTIDFFTDRIHDMCSNMDNYLFVLRENVPHNYIQSITINTSGYSLHSNLFITNLDTGNLNIAGDHAYLEFLTYYCSVDISNPNVPITPLPILVDPETIETLLVHNNNMYIGYAFPFSLAAYSLTDPVAPVEIHRQRGLVHLRDYSIDDNYIYALGGQVDPFYWLMSIDISDPENAGILDVTEEFNLHDAYLISHTGNRIATIGSNGFLELFDCSDPSNLTNVGSIDNTAEPWALKLTDDALYVGNFAGTLTTYDISAWPAIVSTTTIGLSHKPRDIQIRGDMLYVRTTDGIDIFSIADPLAPTAEAEFIPTIDIGDMLIDENYLYVTSNNTFQILDLAIPESPALLGSTSLLTGTSPCYIAVDYPFAFCKDSLSNPATVIYLCPMTAPETTGTLYTDSSPYGTQRITVQDGYYFEGIDQGTIRIFDLD